MYRIIASEGLQSAVLEKDGQLYGSIGPKRIYRIYEEDLVPISKITLGEYLKEGHILHEPPTEIARFEDWPEAVTRYEARLQATGSHAAD